MMPEIAGRWRAAPVDPLAADGQVPGSPHTALAAVSAQADSVTLLPRCRDFNRSREPGGHTGTRDLATRTGS
jgi:hypothetical protein